MAEVGSSQDATDWLFQVKVASCSVGIAVDGHRSASAQRTHAYVIGIVHGTDGQCKLSAWASGRKRVVRPLEGKANDLKYLGIGAFYGPHLGIKPD